MNEARHIIIGTAGHVDHGKTSLIRALTGIETDRLEEERRRGLSIELGFAYFDLPDGSRAGVVDVPGHERFLDTMVAGAHGMDVVLFVVSAREGVQPQTVEHLQILDLLGVRHGILVLTMADIVDEEELEFAIEETRETLEGTTLEGVPHVAVSSITGDGIDSLRVLLVEVAARAVAEQERPHGIPRMPVDRAFTMEGFGLVVTGTLRGGSLNVDQNVKVMPGGAEGRVRGIQVHGASPDAAHAGQRTALNIAGIDREDISRGDVITTPELTHTATNIDVTLRVVSDYPRVVDHWLRARMHIGTREAFCRVVLLEEREGVLPGGEATVQLRLEEPVPLTRGDRYILRDDSVQKTLGGGVIVDPSAARHRRFTDATREALATMRDADDEALIRWLLQRDADPFLDKAKLAPYFPIPAARRKRWIAELARDGIAEDTGAYLIAGDRRVGLSEGIVERLGAYHSANPIEVGQGAAELRAALDGPVCEAGFDWLLARMESADAIRREGSLISLAGHEVQFADQDEDIRREVEDAFLGAGVSAPSVSELGASVPQRRLATVIQTLTQLGTLVKVADDYWMHADAYRETLNRLREHIRAEGSVTIGDFRDMTGATRKYAVPFLEHCDMRNWTYRDGNARRARRSFLEAGDA
ncbi:selenocysteine-specific translation elongation factor [Candidatus Poribacteria bacterium]|nr:selenocysteine-specific translation elongation factor [Candidatus Poribacteria bacterium]